VVVLALMIAVIGLPINHLFSYGVLMIAVIVLAVARVTAQRRSWAIAIVIVLAALIGKAPSMPPRSRKVTTCFLPGGADKSSLAAWPADVYKAMAAGIRPRLSDRRPVPTPRPSDAGRPAPPKRVYAFSFDGIYDKPAYSRRVNRHRFLDAEWQRFGFVNEVAFNW